jgi:hypothetical protein
MSWQARDWTLEGRLHQVSSQMMASNMQGSLAVLKTTLTQPRQATRESGSLAVVSPQKSTNDFFFELVFDAYLSMSKNEKIDCSIIIFYNQLKHTITIQSQQKLPIQLTI